MHIRKPISKLACHYLPVFPADTTPLGCTLAVDTLVEKNKIEPRQIGLAASYLTRGIASLDDLASICITPGFTGQPKSVQCSHKGLVAIQKDYVARLSAKGPVIT